MVGLGGLGYGVYLRRKEEYFEQLFTNLQKCQKYHLDYVDGLVHLPLSKKMILFGTAKPVEKGEVIARSYIKKKKEEENRLWNYEFKDRFRMETGSQ